MRYVRCINNKGFIYNQAGQLFDDTIPDLVIGKVYKVAPPAEHDGDMFRVVDESGEDYLYPANYFEPLLMNENGNYREAVTVHVDDFIKAILHAEALAAKKSVSALLREWIDERLDLPTGAD